jgi:hypothetical protein
VLEAVCDSYTAEAADGRIVARAVKARTGQASFEHS